MSADHPPVWTITTSPLVRAFAVIGSERSATDIIRRMLDIPTAEARALVVLIRAAEREASL